MMTAVLPEVNVAGRYTPGQTRELLQISRTSLYNYTKYGLIQCRRRKVNSRKFYLGSEIIRFWRFMQM